MVRFDHENKVYADSGRLLPLAVHISQELYFQLLVALFLRVGCPLSEEKNEISKKVETYRAFWLNLSYGDLPEIYADKFYFYYQLECKDELRYQLFQRSLTSESHSGAVHNEKYLKLFSVTMC